MVSSVTESLMQASIVLLPPSLVTQAQERRINMVSSVTEQLARRCRCWRWARVRPSPSRCSPSCSPPWAGSVTACWPNRGRLTRGLLRVYLELFRVVPVLVWLYLFFFGLPIFFGLDIPAFWCAVLVLALWGASEVGRSGARRSQVPRPRPAGGRAWRSGSPAGSSIATCCCPRRCNG